MFATGEIHVSATILRKCPGVMSVSVDTRNSVPPKTCHAFLPPRPTGVIRARCPHITRLCHSDSFHYTSKEYFTTAQPANFPGLRPKVPPFSDRSCDYDASFDWPRTRFSWTWVKIVIPRQSC